MQNQTDVEKIKQAIETLEAQRAVLGDEVVDSAVAPLREKLSALQVRPLGEQRKLVTILFADLVGFTELSARLDPEDVRDITGEYFSRWSAVIEQHGGVVEKFIGDAVMVVFGLPNAHEDDPERAVRAALDMQQKLRQLNEELLRKRGLNLSMRVGINTGEVVASLMGERHGEEFVVVGDSVNLASRVQSAAPVDGILVTLDTFRHIRGLFEMAAYGPLQLKGISNPVQAFWVKAAKPRAFRMGERGVEGVKTAMVGRQAEFDLLTGAFDRVLGENEPCRAAVIAEAGLGKSRLLLEFTDWVDLRPERVAFYYGRAYSSSQHTPFSLLRALFAFRCDIQDSDAPELVRQKLEQVTGAALGDDASSRMKAHFIARLLGFEIGESEYENEFTSDAKGFHTRALFYIDSYFRAVASSGPALLLLEDLHWSDDSSLEVIEHLVDHLGGLPVLLACSARPLLLERRPRWGEAGDRQLRLDLKPLPPEASSALVGELLNRVEQPSISLRDLLLQSAEGNPYYIEELVKMLIDDGVIIAGEAQWRVEEQRLGSLRVPPTLVELLQARFDRLAPEEREYLQRGAVIGRIFWDQAVEALGELGQSDARDRAAQVLNHLRGREMIYKNEKSTFDDASEYIFNHALLRDVTYSTLLKRQRRVYHGLAARWLERLTERTHRANEFAMLIATHYEQAGDLEQAAEWYLRAGQLAAARFANLEAVHALSLALDLKPEADSRWTFERLKDREKVLNLLGRRSEQLEDIRGMLSLADDTGDPVFKAQALSIHAQYAFITSDYAVSLEAARKAQEIAAEQGELELAARCSILQASTYSRIGEHPLSQEHAQGALDIAGERNLPAIQAEANRLLGLTAYYTGNARLALDYFSRALSFFEQAGDRSGQALAVNNLGGASFDIGDYESALKYYNLSHQMCTEIGDLVGLGRCYNNLGIVMVSQGNLARAEEYYLQALRVTLETGNRSGEMSALDNLGNVTSDQYRYSQSQNYLRQALQGALAINDRVGRSRILINLGRVLISCGDYEQAGPVVQESIDLNHQLGDQRGLCYARCNLGSLKLAAGDLPGALDEFKQADTIAREMRLESEVAFTDRCQGKVCFEMEMISEALDHLNRAIQITAALGELIEEIDSQAEIAIAYLANGDREQAVQSVEKVLDYLSKHGYEGFVNPAGLYHNLYRALAGLGDPRAKGVLNEGYDLVQKIAAQFDEERQRGAFFNILEVRKLMKAWSD